MPEQSVCYELVDLYFDLLHDKQHALFHRPSFVANHRAGRAPDCLILAMLALTARYAVPFEKIAHTSAEKSQDFLQTSVSNPADHKTAVNIGSRKPSTYSIVDETWFQ